MVTVLDFVVLWRNPVAGIYRFLGNILKSEKLRDTYNLYHCSGVRGKGVDGISPIVPVPPPSFFSMGIKSVGQKDGISWAKRWQKLAKNVYN